MLFKAMIMCEDCGEIHAEKWLESSNRHATTTTLFVLCESCKMNQFLPVDSFLGLENHNKERECYCGKVHMNESWYCSPECQHKDFDPMDYYETEWNNREMDIDELNKEETARFKQVDPTFDPFKPELAPAGVHCTECLCPADPFHIVQYKDKELCDCLPF